MPCIHMVSIFWCLNVTKHMSIWYSWQKSSHLIIMNRIDRVDFGYLVYSRQPDIFKTKLKWRKTTKQERNKKVPQMKQKTKNLSTIIWPNDDFFFVCRLIICMIKKHLWCIRWVQYDGLQFIHLLIQFLQCFSCEWIQPH